MRRKRRWIAWIILGLLAASPLRARAEEGPARPSLQQTASPRPRDHSPPPRDRSCRSPLVCRVMIWMRGSTSRDGRSSCASASSSRTGRAPRRASWSSTSIPGTRSRTRIRRSCPRRWRSSGSVPMRRWTPRGGDWTVADVRVAGKKARFEFDPNLDTIMIVPLGASRGAGGDGLGRGRFRGRLARLLGPLGASQRRHLPAQLVSDPGPPRRRKAGSGRPSSPGTSPGTRRRAITRFASTSPRTRSWPRRAGSPSAAREDRAGRSSRSWPAPRATSPSSARTGSVTDERQVGATLVRVVSFPEHKSNAQRILDYASEVIPLYERWFGPYLRRRVRDCPVVLRLERQRVLGPGPARRPGDAAPLGGCALPRPPGHARDDAPVVLERGRHRWLCRDVHGRGAGQRYDRDAARRQVRPQRSADRLARGAALAPDDRPRGPPAGRLLRLAGPRQRRRR